MTSGCIIGVAASLASAQAGGPALGTVKNPLCTVQAEPTLRSQIWTSMRYVAGIFLTFSALGAFMEGGGLSRGVMNSPDMRPQIDGKTKFSDVKGVDEAKVKSPFIK